ncbi:MAG: stage III sporulation protein AB [Eubacteriales bacterium]
MKLVGMVVLVVFTTLSGFVYAYEIKKGLGQLEAFVSLCGTITGRLERTCSPLDRLYSSLEGEVLEDCGFLPRLRESGAGVYINTWESALDSCIADGSLKLPVRCASLIREYGSGLGKGSLQSQLERCREVSARLDEEYQAMKKDIQGRVRLYSAGGLLAGLFICLLVS